MYVINKRIDDIEESDLLGLVRGGVPEGRLIEFKLTLPSGLDSDKKEFLADVSSFANASGGDIVYGIREEQGAAAEVVGLRTTNLDAERLRLEEIIRNGVEPRIPGLKIKIVPLQTSRQTLIIHVPGSFAQPHMVTFKGASRFYSRNSGGKYRLDVAELRAAFLLTETFAERARTFRMERLSNIVAGETPVKLKEPPIAVLHLVPAGAFDLRAQVDISALLDQPYCVPPMIDYGGFNGLRYNFDGLITHASSGEFASSYVQLFRTGIIEATLGDVKDSQGDGPNPLPVNWLEGHLIGALPTYLRVQRELGIEPPIFLMFSLIGVKGYVLTVGHRHRRQRYDQTQIDRDALLVPEVVLENFEFEPAIILRPIFDTIWNAAGWRRSMSFDESGKWESQR